MSDHSRLVVSDNSYLFQNHLLSAFPKDALKKIKPTLEPFNLPQGTYIHHLDEPIDYIYFPVKGIVSVNTLDESGKSVQIATVGKEGMTGLDAVLGVKKSSHESILQTESEGFRLKARAVLREFKKCGAFQDSVLCYVQAYQLQVSQTAACNRLHTLDEKLAAWLLTTRDSIDSSNVYSTQDFIATLLGVNRVTVIGAATKLQSQGLINYSRGKIRIIKPKGLEEAACSCYQSSKQINSC